MLPLAFYFASVLIRRFPDTRLNSRKEICCIFVVAASAVTISYG